MFKQIIFSLLMMASVSMHGMYKDIQKTFIHSITNPQPEKKEAITQESSAKLFNDITTTKTEKPVKTETPTTLRIKDKFFVLNPSKL